MNDHNEHTPFDDNCYCTARGRPWREERGEVKSQAKSTCSKVGSLTQDITGLRKSLYKKVDDLAKEFVTMSTFRWLFGILVSIIILMVAGGWGISSKMNKVGEGVIKTQTEIAGLKDLIKRAR